MVRKPQDASPEILLGELWAFEGKQYFLLLYLLFTDFWPQRSPWRRSRSEQTQNQNSRPLQPVSEVTRNKLAKYQYKPPADPEANKDEPETADPDNVQSEEQTDKPTATPANKLTWRDFMEPLEPTEDHMNVSPNERIMWNHKTAGEVDNMLTPLMPSKSRKRARSSSPVSSPAEQKVTPAVNVKKLAQALKSPHADPTLELWDRYSLNKNEAAPPVGLANPALAQLMVSSSPRPTKESTPNYMGNLRRTMSHGFGAKRRKIEKSNSNGSRNSQQEMEAASKSSLVTQLLDSVNSSMHERSPTEAIEGVTDQLPALSPPAKSNAQLEDSTPCRPPALSKPTRPESDYGDDDFDDLDLDDDLMELEACINGTQQMEVSESTGTKISRDFLPGLAESHTGLVTSKGTGTGPASQRNSPESHEDTTAPAEKDILEDLDNLDEDFGDLDDEDIDFDAVELAATQSMQKGQESTQTVR